MLIMLLLGVSAGMVAGGFPHAVGSAPILAALLCAACVFPRTRDVLVIGLSAVVARDLLTGLGFFTLVRLGGMISVVGLLRLLRLRPALASVALGLGLSAPAYHLTLAVGDWLTHTCSQEPFTPAGLLATLQSTLPYFQRSFLGELLSTSLLLGLYLLSGSLVMLRWPSTVRVLSSRAGHP